MNYKLYKQVVNPKLLMIWDGDWEDIITKQKPLLGCSHSTLAKGELWTESLIFQGNLLDHVNKWKCLVNSYHLTHKEDWIACSQCGKAVITALWPEICSVAEGQRCTTTKGAK